MTQFAFWLKNHNAMGQRSLEDVIGIFGHTIRALGHTAVWDTPGDKWVSGESGINVIVEGFTPTIIAVIAQGHAQGARFLCLATEEPTPKGFNHGRDLEMVRRQEMFPEAMRYFEGILHLVPGQAVTDWYAQFAPTAYVELGYAPSLIRPFDRTEPEYDFGFFGSLSNRRIKILKKLAKRIGTEKAVKVVGDFATQDERDKQMRRARVIVQIRKHEEMGLVSSSRCNTALSIGRPVVGEPHALSKPWDEIVKFSDTLDSFYDTAIMVRSMWRGVHAAQLDALKAKLPPEVCAGEPLRKIGILEGRKAA